MNTVQIIEGISYEDLIQAYSTLVESDSGPAWIMISKDNFINICLTRLNMTQPEAMEAWENIQLGGGAPEGFPVTGQY